MINNNNLPQISEIINPIIDRFNRDNDALKVLLEGVQTLKDEIVELCRTKASIIQVLCRLRFEQDRALGQEQVNDDFIEVEVTK